MNEFGIAHVWQQGDIIIKSVATILFLMSVTTWSIILIKVVSFFSLNQAAIKSKDKFWSQKSLSTAINQLGKTKFNPFRDLAITGSAALSHQHQHESSLSQALDLSEWIARSLKYSLDDSASRLQSGLGFLASIGSTAPFIGLFGTVWGIYHALQAISLLDQPDIAHVAGPVGEALVMTALGLFVAIPAVLGFNAISRRNKSIMHSASRFAHDLHAYFLTGNRVTAKNDVINDMYREPTENVHTMRNSQSV